MSAWSKSAAVQTDTAPGAPFEPLSAGNLLARVAASDADIDAAQALRYRVFYDEMKARPSIEVAQLRRDFDSFDPFCDHLLVIDTEANRGAGAVVGTYRVMRRAAAARKGGFYSESEFDIKPLLDLPGEILELGRSCVDANYRTRSTMNLLWRSIAAYVSHYDIGVMFGCASLSGTDVEAHAMALSYLHYHHLAPPALRPRALPERYVDMRRTTIDRIDPRAALASLPPLVKGYLRLGGFVGDGAVIDADFNTTDVSIIVKTELVTEKYVRHYERAMRESAG
jgi:putative hemolysin